MDLRACIKCRLAKPPSEFHKSGRQTGRRNTCKACCRAQSLAKYYDTGAGAKYRAYTRAYKDANWDQRLLDSAQSASRQRSRRGRNCPCEVTREYIASLWSQQRGLCYFTSLPMVKERNRLDTVSIDRLDPSKGYEPGNVVLATKAANFAKTGHSESEFREFLDRVADSIVSSRRIKSVA